MDMAKPACTYCGTALPHHARAAQQVAVVNQIMADRGASGMPRAFEGLLGNAPHGQPHLMGVHVPPGAQVTPFGAPPGVPAVYAQLHQQGMQAANTARTLAIAVSVGVFVIVLLLIGVGVAMSLLTAQ
jgi:hypothetical protein